MLLIAVAWMYVALMMAVAEAMKGTRLRVGAQDCHEAASGANTGDISAEMVADAGGEAVIVGHSERRADHGDLDRTVRSKALAAHRAGLAAIDRHLPAATTTRPDGGFFLSVTLPEGVTTRAVRARAQHYQLNLADGEAFFPEGGGERFLRLPYCALTPAEIDEGVRRLARVVADVRGR